MPRKKRQRSTTKKGKLREVAGRHKRMRSREHPLVFDDNWGRQRFYTARTTTDVVAPPGGRYGIRVRGNPFRRELLVEGWHGSYAPMRRIRRGLHFGTAQSALDRLNLSLHRYDPERPIYLYRLQVRSKNPLGSVFRPLTDSSANRLETETARRARRTHRPGVGYVTKPTPRVDLIFYRNAVEDQGSISVVGKDPKKIRVKEVMAVPGDHPLRVLARKEEVEGAELSPKPHQGDAEAYKSLYKKLSQKIKRITSKSAKAASKPGSLRKRAVRGFAVGVQEALRYLRRRE